MQAELPSLAPGTLHTIRVRAGRGDSAKTLFTVQFRSPAREPLITVNWTEVLALIAVALSGVAAFKRWKNRKLWKW
jgi:hypothetical protein